MLWFSLIIRSGLFFKLSLYVIYVVRVVGLLCHLWVAGLGPRRVHDNKVWAIISNFSLLFLLAFSGGILVA